LRDILRKCLEKDARKRYQSAAGLYQDLLDYQKALTAPAPKAVDLKELLRPLRRPRIAICAVLVFLLLCICAYWLINRSAKVRWARKALPEIERLIGQDKYLAAFSLAREAEKYVSKDPMLAKLWPRMSGDLSINTTPAGADIFFKEYSAAKSQWEYLGVSPLESVRFPNGVYRWQIRKEGFEAVETVLSGNTFTINLNEKGSLPLGMVSIPQRALRVSLAYFRYGQAAVKAPAYLIDKCEVTNQQFKDFVDNGGYRNRDYWKNEFAENGNILSWEQAMAQFRDKMGRLGPSTWEGGTYPKGQEKYPVSGVSWYEAAAYAEFAGKSLPTIYHWSTVACVWQAQVIIPFSNFGGEGPTPVGSHPGMGHTGLYDMAGNVKEWCRNAVGDSGERRYILGGAWSEADYMFTHADARSPWDRSATNGFRCVQYPGGSESVPETLFRPVARSFRDYGSVIAVSDEIFQIYRNLYLYDQATLNDAVESVDESPEYWTKEKILFDAAYGGERVIAYLFLPKGVKPPYQTVVYFPGSGAIRQRSSENLQIGLIDFIIQSGRAVLYPIYKETCERNDGRTSDVPDKTISYRDWIIQLGKDLRKSVDYLETRDDIDVERIGYYGVSWGAELGPIMLAVEDRIKLGVLLVGGLHGRKKLPEVDEVNFAPYVKVPVLMINGKHDHIFPVESSQKPFFEFLGTRDEDKKHILYPGAHGLFRLFSRQIRGDILAWLDRYLGPVD
jgi:formylglycine-generating enzyme required for sulfatase activity/dienelactone hydrolase